MGRQRFVDAMQATAIYLDVTPTFTYPSLTSRTDPAWSSFLQLNLMLFISRTSTRPALHIRNPIETKGLVTASHRSLASPASLPSWSHHPARSARHPLATARDSTGQLRRLSKTTVLKMATDEDYMSFLDKANQEADEAHASAQRSSQSQFKAMDAGSEVPKAIKNVCKEAIYISETDEPFEEVSLKWTGEGGLPDEGTSENQLYSCFTPCWQDEVHYVAKAHETGLQAKYL